MHSLSNKTGKLFQLNFYLRICFLAVLLLVFPISVLAQNAVISDLVVANSKTDLLAFFKIEGAFSPEMRQGVLHGIPVTFTFEFALDRVRNGWLNSEVRAGDFEHTMTYDNLKKEFTVLRKEGITRQLVTADIQKAMDFMVEVESVKLAALEEMRPDSRYTLRVKATLAKTTLPLNFHYIIPFTKFWDLKTEWTEVDFRY